MYQTKYLIVILLLSVLCITNAYTNMDIFNLFGETKSDDKIDIRSINNEIQNQIKRENEMKNKARLNSNYLEEERIKKEITLKIKEKIREQIEREMEIQKYKKYYEISKERLRKESETNEDDEIIRWVEKKNQI